MLVGRRKTAVAGFFAHDTHKLRGIVVKDDNRHSKSEILEVLAHTGEITSEVVLQKKILYLVLHLWRTSVGVVLQTSTVAHLGIELLTGGKCFIIFDFSDDIIRHSVIHSPRDKTLPTFEDTAVKICVLTKHRAAIRHKRHRCLGIRQLLYTWLKIKVHNLSIYTAKLWTKLCGIKDEGY